MSTAASQISPLLASQIENIRQIDKLIDGIRLAIYRRVGPFEHWTPRGWQIAWNRCPDLREREIALFRLRGIAQQTRDEIMEREYQAVQRRERAARRIRNAA